MPEGEEITVPNNDEAINQINENIATINEQIAEIELQTAELDLIVKEAGEENAETLETLQEIVQTNNEQISMLLETPVTVQEVVLSESQVNEIAERLNNKYQSTLDMWLWIVVLFAGLIVGGLGIKGALDQWKV